MEIEIPDKCPICRKITNNLLLHMRKKDSCYEKIGKDQFEKWKRETNKRSKRKYQSKYVKDGRHSNAQNKFMKKCNDEDKESSLYTQAQRKAKTRNREIIAKLDNETKEGQEKRMNNFQTMCCWILFQLREGKICYTHVLNQFHLIEQEFAEEYYDDLHAWMKDISGALLSKIMTFQQIALVSRFRWKIAIKKAKDDPSKLNYLDTIYRVIGKLNSYNHTQTKDITIPENYESKCKATDECPMKYREMIPGSQGWKKEGKKRISIYRLSKEEETTLISLIDDIIGNEEDFQDEYLGGLLKIHRIMKNVQIALNYVTP